MSSDIKKDADCATRQASQYQKSQDHFILIADRVKAGFVKLAVWVSIAWGA
jgi:hypothetical protein